MKYLKQIRDNNTFSHLENNLFLNMTKNERGVINRGIKLTGYKLDTDTERCLNSIQRTCQRRVKQELVHIIPFSITSEI